MTRARETADLLTAQTLNVTSSAVLQDLTVNGTQTIINTLNATYIYAAFAEAPSINLYGAQANAR